MNLSRENLRVLFVALTKTHDDEVDCDHCESYLAALAESEIAGEPICEELLQVEKHIDLCADCCEEFNLLTESILLAMKAA
ncbi:MAG: hypothetical protein IPP57_11845 [Candidatus Obscuribacter sp.]|jgi:hypothetical protein|nr:hypothetical protein [Candidatus Obscuribacter sp.]MDQ5966617.1 hypothetical protein [Cyanobacteriota bacterium erpe_2018_sw_39hr_WHONDRS-SW48-000098_B_bin.30]MBK9621040.1 hypothetical protein [Candidatus Obscuribacter sp.]MBK9771500.1 hypothetical protein [Candidatus Obscuribacter sp.]MBL0185466.1 hypothetical protein [Candidatus Obscuribacter sp.]